MNIRQNRKTTVYIFRFVAVLLIAILITTQLLSGMFARFSTTASSSAHARVAAFVFDVRAKEGSFTLDLSDIRIPGDSKEFTFIIQNFDAVRTSEVAQSYEVTLTELGSLPLSYTCSCVEIAENPVTLNADIEEGTRSFTGTFEPSKQASYTYTIKVEWPEEYNDPKYASGSGIASLEIRIVSEQID